MLQLLRFKLLLDLQTLNVNPSMLGQGFRMISTGIPYALPYGHEANDVPTFWLLLYPVLETMVLRNGRFSGARVV